jgi:5-formyltetrahydrofolate cyclo-ligase
MKRSTHFSKTQWRDTLLTRRSQITLVDREHAARNAAEFLVDLPLFRQVTNIACYYPLPHEFDCLQIIERIWAAQKNCYLPVLSTINQDKLDFILYEKDTVLRHNRYHIPEPEEGKKIAPENLDLVLLPSLGFDRQGNRLGMGAGYYDRTFQAHEKMKKPVLFGLAYEAQCVSSLPHDPWDVVLDGAVTENRIVFF